MTEVMSVFDLARLARQRRRPRLWVRPDGAVDLQPLGGPDLGKIEPQIREVHFHPRKGEELHQTWESLASLRRLHPEALLHGLSPGWVSQHGRDALDRACAAGLQRFCWFTGELGSDQHPAAQGWQALADAPVDKVAVFVYGPEHSLADAQQRLQLLAGASRLQQVLPLPRAAGDLVLISGATTDGVRDIEMLAFTRSQLDAQVCVRASWAALGFKLAQSSLAFGADGYGGWGLEELLTYTSRCRPADRVTLDQALAGAAEAGMEPE
jgi:hypothetical protein